MKVTTEVIREDWVSEDFENHYAELEHMYAMSSTERFYMKEWNYVRYALGRFIWKK